MLADCLLPWLKISVSFHLLASLTTSQDDSAMFLVGHSAAKSPHSFKFKTPSPPHTAKCNQRKCCYTWFTSRLYQMEETMYKWKCCTENCSRTVKQNFGTWCWPHMWGLTMYNLLCTNSPAGLENEVQFNYHKVERSLWERVQMSTVNMFKWWRIPVFFPWLSFFCCHSQTVEQSASARLTGPIFETHLKTHDWLLI